jgi:hypothetical protein
VYEVGDDELILPDNEKGEAKVDALGRLQGGGFRRVQAELTVRPGVQSDHFYLGHSKES